MKVDVPPVVQAYLDDSVSWDMDRLRRQRWLLRCAWSAAALGWLTGIGGVASAAWQASRPPAEPVVLRVSEATGAVDVLDHLRGGTASYSEAIHKYFVEWYVRYREGYARELAPDYYSNVARMSAREVFSAYATGFDPKNPESPLQRYGDHVRARISVQSTSFVAPGVALVRFARIEEEEGAAAKTSHWVATVTYRFTETPRAEEDRRINPLGFQATGYRCDPDAATEDPKAHPGGREAAASAPSAGGIFPQAPTVLEEKP